MTTDPVPSSPYPAQWEADVVLSDGGVVHLRPVRFSDREPLRDTHSRMSERSKYLRYFTAVGQVTDQQLGASTDVDFRTSAALVAELGDKLIAVGSFHVDKSGLAAEVAFTVEDAHQGRGVGSILLEHLAAAAQEMGIRQFTAEVLNENTSMVRVFIDAGYQVNREFDSGIVDLSFDIAPTDKSRAVQSSREQRAEARSIARLLSPAGIAVIGASNDPSKLGHAVLQNLLAGPFTGPVHPVHPEAAAVQGVRAYREVTDIPDTVDLAVLTVPAGTVAEVVEACRRKGVHGLVVMASGFADAPTDPAGGTAAAAGGVAAQRALVATARGNGMRVVGPNCLGVINTDPAVAMNATLAPVIPPAGRVGFFCQSGALGIAILADAAARVLGLSSFVSAGNRADVSGNDLLQFWQSDPRTELVLLYLESFGNPRKFARLARTLARSKPVIVVKSGRHAVIAPGLAASTTALSAQAVDTVFRQSGVIRTETLSQAFDVAQLLAVQPLPRPGSVAVLGNSTALGVLAVDACLDAGLPVAGGGPADLGVNVTPEELAAAVGKAVADPDVSAVMVVYVPPVAVPGRPHAQALRDAAAGSPVPVLTTFLGVDGLVDALRVVADNGIGARGSVPSFRSPERAIAALAMASSYASWRSAPIGVELRPSEVRPEKARDLVDSWPAGPEVEPLTDEQLVALLGAYGIDIVEFREATSRRQAVTAARKIGFPVLLKTFDVPTRERLANGGVRGSLNTADQVGSAYEVLAALGGPQVYVQRMADQDRSGVSTVFEIVADPTFGALVSFGIAGVTTELLDDRGYRAVPLTDTDADELLTAPRAAPLLTGYRGRTPVDRGQLAELALRLSALADDVPELIAARISVLAGPAGYTVVSATGRRGPVRAKADTRRMMR